MEKKILIFANCGDGLYLFRMELIAALQKSAEVIVALPFDSHIDDIRTSGCTLIETPMERRGMNPLKDLKLFRSYLKIIRAVQPDFIITYTIKCNIYGCFAARCRHVPYAANITGLGTAFQGSGLLTKLVTFMNKTALKRAHVVFFENVANKDVFVRLGIVHESICHPLHGAGVNLDKFAPTPYPDDTGVFRFLFIGRVMKEKGIGELFDAMERLHAEGIACELHVLGGFEEDFKDRIQKYEAQGWLHYHGFVSDVRPFIADSHCFVLPSYHEGMANVNLESAAMGRPLITTAVPGCMEAVIDGQTGFLCEKANADSLYGAMKRMLGQSREQRMNMGLAGRVHMEHEFDKKKVVAETVETLGFQSNLSI